MRVINNNFKAWLDLNLDPRTGNQPILEIPVLPEYVKFRKDGKDVYINHRNFRQSVFWIVRRLCSINYQSIEKKISTLKLSILRYMF